MSFYEDTYVEAYRELSRATRAKMMAQAVLAVTIPASIVGVLFIIYIVMSR